MKKGIRMDNGWAKATDCYICHGSFSVFACDKQLQHSENEEGFSFFHSHCIAVHLADMIESDEQRDKASSVHEEEIQREAISIHREAALIIGGIVNAVDIMFSVPVPYESRSWTNALRRMSL